jgi:choline dehydrogenase-like flavoprotein
MLHYYRKFHTLTVPSQEICSHLGIDWIEEGVRGTNGPVQASFQGVIQDPISNAWVETFKKLGHGLKRDPFSGEAIGGYSSPITVDPNSKVRSYAANTYFAAAGARPNLRVVTGSLVEKILFEPFDDMPSAKGVTVDIQGEKHTVTARKEVILAAGVFQTPKLLELSGIGNKDLLQSHGIPMIVENPNVGENLQDHLMTGISFEVNDGIFTGDGLMRQEPELVQGAMQMYTTAKAGPLCAGGIGSYAFMSITDSLSKDAETELATLLDEDNPRSKEDMQAKFLQSVLATRKEATGAMFMFPAQVNLHNDPKSKSFVQDLRPGNFLSIGAALLHPFSRGSVHITSPSPTAAPKIDPKYLSSPLDLLILASHLQFISKLASSQPLASLLKPNGRRNHPSANDACDSLEKAKAYVKETAISNNHPACTCAMLPRDKGGVVSEKLVVHGTRGLRVVDASVMPTIPRANTQATVYAVAERAADLIKGDYHL